MKSPPKHPNINIISQEIINLEIEIQRQVLLLKVDIKNLLYVLANLIACEKELLIMVNIQCFCKIISNTGINHIDSDNDNALIKQQLLRVFALNKLGHGWERELKSHPNPELPLGEYLLECSKQEPGDKVFLLVQRYQPLHSR